MKSRLTTLLLCIRQHTSHHIQTSNYNTPIPASPTFPTISLPHGIRTFLIFSHLLLDHKTPAQILGGGLPLGTLLLVLEDSFAPLHLILLRYFLAQGISHSQPLLLAAPLPSPQAFLGTLPALASVQETGGWGKEAGKESAVSIFAILPVALLS